MYKIWSFKCPIFAGNLETQLKFCAPTSVGNFAAAVYWKVASDYPDLCFIHDAAVCVEQFRYELETKVRNGVVL